MLAVEAQKKYAGFMLSELEHWRALVSVAMRFHWI